MCSVRCQSKIYRFYYLINIINISDSENLLNGNTPTPIASQKAFNIIADSLRRIDVSLTTTTPKIKSISNCVRCIFFSTAIACASPINALLLHRQSISKSNSLSNPYFPSFPDFFLCSLWFSVKIDIFLHSYHHYNLLPYSNPLSSHSVLSARKIFSFRFFMIC